MKGIFFTRIVLFSEMKQFYLKALSCHLKFVPIEAVLPELPTVSFCAVGGCVVLLLPPNVLRKLHFTVVFSAAPSFDTIHECGRSRTAGLHDFNDGEPARTLTSAADISRR